MNTDCIRTLQAENAMLRVELQRTRQYLELLKVTEKAQREIKRDLPRLEKYQKKVIIIT